MPGVYDRLTVNGTQQKHLDLMRKFRVVCGNQSVNRTLLLLIEQYVKEQEAKGKMG